MLRYRIWQISAVFMIVLLMFGAGSLLAQPPLTTPRVSPAAEVSQTIGLTKIKISYHRPAVNERKIWGKLVPYGQVWRAGANENTTISFSDPVKIEGQPLPAGTYGLHMIPTEKDWTIIFSRTSTAWGSFGYTPDEDVLRVQVTPEKSPFQERLNYRFDDPDNSQTVVALYWEALRVPFKVEVDAHQAVVKNMQQELRGLHQFFWQSWNQAANYCMQNDVNHQQALEWVNRSISMNKNLLNMGTKARLLTQMGNTTEADAVWNETWDMAMNSQNETQVNQFGYQLLFAGETDKAIQVFKKNVEKHPDSWNVYDSLAEGFAKKGDTKNAITYYNKALNMTELEGQKTRIKNVLAQLKSQ